MKKRAFRKRQRQGRNSRSLSNRKRTQQSEFARDRALHVLSAMRRDPNLSLSKAAKLEGVKPDTVKKHFASSLRKVAGTFRVTKSDRHVNRSAPAASAGARHLGQASASCTAGAATAVTASAGQMSATARSCYRRCAGPRASNARHGRSAPY